jgi:hypothetical protein
VKYERETMELHLKLLDYSESQFSAAFLVKDRRIAEYNTLLQIALIFQ